MNIVDIARKHLGQDNRTDDSEWLASAVIHMSAALKAIASTDGEVARDLGATCAELARAELKRWGLE